MADVRWPRLSRKCAVAIQLYFRPCGKRPASSPRLFLLTPCEHPPTVPPIRDLPRFAEPQRRPTLAYRLYGASVRSHWPLPYLAGKSGGANEVELIEGSEEIMREASMAAAPLDDSEWFEYRTFNDQSTYLRWLGLYEFLVSSDGHRVIARMPKGVSEESFRVYLLNGALPVALLKLGYDPLHATAVVIEGQSVGFLGRSGYGKSTLGGAFLQAGYPVLTDDLVVLKQEQDCWMAHPGPPRIKLLPESAAIVAADRMRGSPMNEQTQKLVIPLSARQSFLSPVPMKGFYVLNRPTGYRASTIRIRRLYSRRALLSLVKNSYNDWLSDPERLHHQLLQYSRIAAEIPVKLLSYPRILDGIQDVRNAILADLNF